MSKPKSSYYRSYLLRIMKRWTEYALKFASYMPLPPKSIDYAIGASRYSHWVRKNNCNVISNNDRTMLYEYINNVILKNAPIDYLEFGVAKGTSLKYWLGLNKNESSRFIGFDCFEGLPEDWDLPFSGCRPKGTCDTGGILPQISDPRIRLVPGFFQETLTKFLTEFAPKNRLVIHCDADLYSSTLYVLSNINEIIEPGTIIIFDEFSTFNHEFQAFSDFTSAFMRKYRPLAAVGSTYMQIALEIEE